MTRNNEHIYVVVDRSVPEDYWNGWWEWSDVRSGPTAEQDTVILKSLRTGSAADVDLEVLTGRLASGLYRVPERVDDTLDSPNDALTSEERDTLVSLVDLELEAVERERPDSEYHDYLEGLHRKLMRS